MSKTGKGIIVGLATTGLVGAAVGGIIGANKKSETEKDNIRQQAAQDTSNNLRMTASTLQQNPNDTIAATNYITAAKEKAIAGKMATKQKSNLTTIGAIIGVAASIAIAITAVTVTGGAAVLPLLVTASFLPVATTLAAYGYSKYKSDNFKSEATKIGNEATKQAEQQVSQMSSQAPQQNYGHYTNNSMQQQQQQPQSTPPTQSINNQRTGR
jgi:hypothetical protein